MTRWITYLLTTTYLLLGQQSSGQTIDSLKEFTVKWKNDSLGKNSDRMKYVVLDSVQKVYLVNGKNLNGYKKKTIIALLGEPNFYGTFQYQHAVGLFWGHTHRERGTMNYRLHWNDSTDYLHDYLTFVIRGNKVYYENKKYIEKHEIF